MSEDKFPCQVCGMQITAFEYHPLGFCLLYQADIDPKEFVREAAFNIRYVIPKPTEGGEGEGDR